MQINKYILNNGLRVVHHEDNSTKMVAVNLLYDVGSRDESPEHTGFAHLFEHLMFGGSKHIPNYDIPLQTAGGENNAWTNNDITNYYLTVPYQNVELAFWLESDRMLSLDFSQKNLDVQRAVVIEEFKQRCLNQPYGDVNHLIRELAYKKHSYQWPAIGKELSHIANATLKEVEDFFYHFYAPNNAILSVSGNITFQEVKRLAEKWFAAIPQRDVPLRRIPLEPKQEEKRLLVVERDVPVDALFMVYHMCERCHSDYYVYDMLSDLLCNGVSSRLYQHLVLDKGILSSVDAYISGSIDAGLFHLSAKLADGITHEEAEAALKAELEDLKVHEVEAQELEKVKNKYESSYIFSNVNYLNVATNLAYFELLGNAANLGNEVDKYRAVTSNDLTRVAQDAFVDSNLSVLYYRKRE